MSIHKNHKMTFFRYDKIPRKISRFHHQEIKGFNNLPYRTAKVRESKHEVYECHMQYKT